MAQGKKQLYRDVEDKKIAGVCSGLARYFDIDPVLVRVGFVVLVFLGGGGIVAYIILWIVMNPAPPGYWSEPLPPVDPNGSKAASQEDAAPSMPRPDPSDSSENTPG